MILVVTATAFAISVLLWRLQRAERRAGRLFEDLPIACQEIDVHGRCRRINAAACELLGRRAEEVVGRPVWEFMNAGRQDEARARVESDLSAVQRLEPFDCNCICGDGARRRFRMFLTQLRDRRGRVMGIRASILDITDAVQTEQALRESEESYRRLFQNIPIGIYRTTPDGRVLMANPACIEMLGYESYDEVAGLDLEKCTGESYDRMAFKSELERAGEVLGRESVLTGKDGKQVHVNESARAIRGPGGNLVYYEGTLEDITERKRAFELLRASEERYRGLFDSAHDIIYSHDLNGRLTALNRSGERLLGYARHEALGRDISHILKPLERGRLQDLVCAQLAGAPASPCEFHVRTRAGTWIPLEISTRLLFEDGIPVGLMGVARDVADRKRWEDELRRKNEELELALNEAHEATEAKSRFLANMSHEIRTPMNGIAGMTELLLASDLTAEQRECAEAVRKSAEALLHIIGDILDFSKIEAGKMSIRPVRFGPGQLVDEVAQLLRVQARENGVVLRTRIDPHVPAEAEADSGRIRQVLLNLVGNAVKFTDAGWIEIRLKASLNDGRFRLAFEVEDTGIGFGQEEARRLFESFVQLDSSLTRRYGGTGLGLAISKQLVELMGGQMTFESRPGLGSTFRFSIPARFGKTGGDHIEAVNGSAADPAPSAPQGVRILLAEDIEMNRRIATRMLERLGYHADAVCNGQLAIEAVRSARYDVVFMDVHMPEMDGFAATREIRRVLNGASGPVIVAMTARAMAGDREKCIAAGMDDYISKPVRIEDLRATLQRWIHAGSGGKSAGDSVPVTAAQAF